MSQRLLLAFVLGFVVVAATRDIAAVTIVQDGEPRATIVVREAVLESDPYRPDRYDAGSPEQKVHLAAHDLQHYLEKITGAKLPIVSDSRLPFSTTVRHSPIRSVFPTPKRPSWGRTLQDSSRSR